MFKKLSAVGISAAMLLSSAPAFAATTSTKEISRMGRAGNPVTGTKTHTQDVSTSGNATTKSWTNDKTINRKNGTATQHGQGTKTTTVNPDGSKTVTTNRNGTRTGVGGKTYNYSIQNTRTR